MVLDRTRSRQTELKTRERGIRRVATRHTDETSLSNDGIQTLGTGDNQGQNLYGLDRVLTFSPQKSDESSFYDGTLGPP